jgi:hypothetical protein
MYLRKGTGHFKKNTAAGYPTAHRLHNRLNCARRGLPCTEKVIDELSRKGVGELPSPSQRFVNVGGAEHEQKALSAAHPRQELRAQVREHHPHPRLGRHTRQHEVKVSTSYHHIK